MKSERKEYISKWKFLVWLPEIKIDWNIYFKHGFYPYWAESKSSAIFEYWRFLWFEVRRVFASGGFHPGLARIEKTGYCAGCGTITNFWDFPTKMYVCPNCNVGEILKEIAHHAEFPNDE